MQLIPALGACVIGGLSAPAYGQICTLALDSGGTLALSSDGTVLGSEQGLAIGAIATIISIGSNTIEISAATRVSADPAGYNSSFETVEVAYAGLGGLGFVDQPYTNVATDFDIGTIGLSILEIQNRIVNPNGFVAGSYTTRTVLTCS